MARYLCSVTIHSLPVTQHRDSWLITATRYLWPIACDPLLLTHYLRPFTWKSTAQYLWPMTSQLLQWLMSHYLWPVTRNQFPGTYYLWVFTPDPSPATPYLWLVHCDTLSVTRYLSPLPGPVTCVPLPVTHYPWLVICDPLPVPYHTWPVTSDPLPVTRILRFRAAFDLMICIPFKDPEDVCWSWQQWKG